MSVNKVILVGRLGRDPETRYTGGGQAVANFSVATDESYRDKNGERQKRTEWHKIVVWGKQAEIAQQYLKKGSLIFIEGRIQSREWQDKEARSVPASKSWPAIFACWADVATARRAAVSPGAVAARSTIKREERKILAVARADPRFQTTTFPFSSHRATAAMTSRRVGPTVPGAFSLHPSCE